MNTYEEIRKTVLIAFKTFHDASTFASVPINFPNYSTIDVEHLTSPFVSTQMVFSTTTEVFDVTAIDDIVRGELLVSYLYPEGTGINKSTSYSDMLRGGFCHKKLSGITFFGVSVLQVSPYPGISGEMNVVKFMI